jgi:hypothetical protein
MGSAVVPERVHGQGISQKNRWNPGSQPRFPPGELEESLSPYHTVEYNTLLHTLVDS